MQTEIPTETSPTPFFKENRNVIIVVLIAAFLGTGGYLIFTKISNTKKLEDLVQRHEKAELMRKELQESYEVSLVRLDSIAGVNYQLEATASTSNSIMATLQKEIDAIFRKQGITEAELAKAKRLIAELNERIRVLTDTIARLTLENKALEAEKAALALERDSIKLQTDSLYAATQELAEKVTIASTLNTYSITVTPVKNQRSKQIPTRVAKKVDNLVLAFDVDNRILASGSTEIYLIIIGPDGKAIQADPLQAGTFISREEGEKPFTAVIPVDIETGKKKRIEFKWNQKEAFKKGSYQFAIYHNGFKIGESSMELKNSGMFG